MRIKVAAPVLAAFLLSPFPPLSAGEAGARTISVHGDAEVKVVPDMVLISVGLETRGEQLPALRAEHEQRMKAILNAAREAGIQEKDLQADYLRLEPEMGSTSKSRQPMVLGYVERSTLVATLRDVSHFEPVLTALLGAGATHIHGIDFRTSKLRTYRDQARSLAIKAAKEKAVALAGDLGQRVTRPQSIQEGHSNWWSSYSGWWGARGSMASQNVSLGGGTATEASDSSVAPGTISVQASVNVTFELE